MLEWKYFDDVELGLDQKIKYDRANVFQIWRCRMKKVLIAMSAVAVLLAFGLCSHAQDKTTATPPQDSAVDNQASLSDEVIVPGDVESVAPVAPVEQGTSLAPAAVNVTSDCLGCGQAAPVAQGCATSCCPSTACESSRCRTVRFRSVGRKSADCGTTCCQSGCTACASLPVTNCTAVSECGCSSTISPVSYQQPVVENGCNTCGDVTPVYVSSCDQCPTKKSRGRRGRLFRNR